MLHHQFDTRLEKDNGTNFSMYEGRMFVVMEKTSETFFIKKPLTYAMLKHLEKMIIFPPP